MNTNVTSLTTITGSLSKGGEAPPGRMTLETCIAAWIHAKSNRSESQKTERAYQDTLAKFRDMLKGVGQDLDADPGIIAPLAQGWAGLPWNGRGRRVSPATYNQRLAILSSFYLYALKHGVLAANPIERVERRIVKNEQAARSLSPETVITGLEQIDRALPVGQRDYAILAIMLETGRRVSEIAGLRYGHLRKQGKSVQILWVRCKGNKQMQDTLTEETTAVLYDYLHTIYGDDLAEVSKEAPVWVSFSGRSRGKAIKTLTIQRVCETYFQTSKAHATRHTWAVSMHHEGASLAEIGRGLGHSNLATTSRYMEEQLGHENLHATKLVRRFGIKRREETR